MPCGVSHRQSRVRKAQLTGLCVKQYGVPGVADEDSLVRVLERLHENLALVPALAGRARVHPVSGWQHGASLEPVLLVADRHDQLNVGRDERVDKHAVVGAFILSSVSEDQLERGSIAKSLRAMPLYSPGATRYSLSALRPAQPCSALSAAGC